MDDYTELPTVDEAREFLRLVNVGREAVEMEPLAVLDFDDAAPASSETCLSALSLFVVAAPAIGDVGSTTVVTDVRVAQALGMEQTEWQAGRWYIPDAIRRVTDPFDNEMDGLRERLVEAGVVAL